MNSLNNFDDNDVCIRVYQVLILLEQSGMVSEVNMDWDEDSTLATILLSNLTFNICMRDADTTDAELLRWALMRLANADIELLNTKTSAADITFYFKIVVPTKDYLDYRAANVDFSKDDGVGSDA